MLNKAKKWSILLYVILLVNIALVVWVVVYNNSYVIINNLDIGNNQEEVFSNIYNKAHIAINSVQKYNSNGGWFVDGLSCPTWVTMSWTLNRQTNIATQFTEEHWNIYCKWEYRWNEFRIYYNEENEDFDRTTYWPNPFYNDTVEIVQSLWTDIYLSPNNLALDSSTRVSHSSSYPWFPWEHINDDNISTQYISSNPFWNKVIEFDFWRELKVWQIIIRKNARNSSDWRYWTNGRILFKDRSQQIDWDKEINLPEWLRSQWYSEYNLAYSGLAKETQYLELTSWYGYLDLYEFEIYELLSNGSEELWQWDRSFFDNDNTFVTFNTDGIHWDGIDSDLNSDNYRVTSKDDIYFPNGYQDDDVVPRKTIFWSIQPNTEYEHVYWNNYRTHKVIDENINNDDILNVKIWDVNNGHLFLNTFNTEDLNYSIKILEFDRTVYEEQYTLLPLDSHEWKEIKNYLGYIQKDPDTWFLSVAKEKTWNEFVFDFSTKDYALFIANQSDSILSYHLEWYTDTGSGIYINPIDDSATWSITVLSNHIIIGWEKNFIWENFEVIWSK